MTDASRRRLPPMEAIEFSIAAVFGQFFFALRLVLGWLVLLLPLMALVWFVAFRTGPPDMAALDGASIAALAALGAGVLLAAFSIAVNWQRRILLGETPRRLAWVRLDGVVWRYTAGFLLILIVLGAYAGAAFGVTAIAAPALEPQLGPAARPLGIAVAVLLGFSALFTAYRLSSWLAGLAVGDRDYPLKTAWKATRKNRLAYLGFTFWIVFTLAIAGALGAGAFLAQQAQPDPWIKAAAFALIGLLTWMTVFLLVTAAASHYAHFARGGSD